MWLCFGCLTKSISWMIFLTLGCFGGYYNLALCATCIFYLSGPFKLVMLDSIKGPGWVLIFYSWCHALWNWVFISVYKFCTSENYSLFSFDVGLLLVIVYHILLQLFSLLCYLFCQYFFKLLIMQCYVLQLCCSHKGWYWIYKRKSSK